MIFSRTWSSSKGGRSLVTSLKVADGPERTGMSVGLFSRIHCRVGLGDDILLMVKYWMLG